MKTITLTAALLIGACSTSISQEKTNNLPPTTISPEDASLVDYSGFAELTKKLEPIRQKRLVTTDQFRKMANEKNTIILDTRSKAAFDEVHVKGAVHLNFSDFTEEKLAKVIPSKDTRILIYCNNNFVSSFAALTSKKVELALNIPTFVNLYGYGYENLYELGELVISPTAGIALDETRPILEVEGSAVDSE